MSKLTKQERWLVKYYQGAIGFKITAATLSKDGFPQLICQKGRGREREEIVLEVSQDEEGNGAGFLFGLPHPDVFPSPVNKATKQHTKEKVDELYQTCPKGRNPNDLPDDLLAGILNKRLTPDEAWKAFDFRKGLDKIHANENQ